VIQNLSPFSRLGLLALVLTSACATKFKVSTYPTGAKVRVENVVTKENFEIGEGPVSFPFDERYGEGFVMVVEKESFAPKKIFVSRTAGSETSFQINLEPKRAGDGTDTANADDKKDDKKEPNKEENDKEMDKRLAVLERTFEIYKDALFSQRYGTGPASYDRDRVDTSVSLVAKAQQLIENRKLTEAKQVVQKIIDKDEYMVQGHVLQGTIAYLEGDYQDSIKSWERALEINPYERLTRQYLVNVYRKVGRQLPDNVDELEAVDRSPAASPLRPDPLKLRLRARR
jgi:tetratricopeptide (TPR) repeat protein